MKTYRLSFAASLDHTPAHPERTATRTPGFDVEYREWPNQAAMIAALLRQGRKPAYRLDWRAWQPRNRSNSSNASAEVIP